MIIFVVIIIMNKSQETTFFSEAPEMDFRYETKSRKVIVDFKFDEVSQDEVDIVVNLIGSCIGGWSCA